ncbi:pseudaminic acid synthase [uncultured Paraglaciecola sp.]|uniref:pseudaminic acid synthase n=1 Tax=uncultured Paraglaciecola sp. TaxID=1765024 RepID=UPI0025E191B4|nr:pseudaminic acid synthase [uncultured Paraglaciecola sp.]
MKELSHLNIKGRLVGYDQAPYVIAEMSANHNGNLDKAIEIIAMAKASGVDAVKIQTYTPDTLTIDCDFPDFQLTEGLWQGRSLYQLYQEAFMPWEWHKTLFDYAQNIGITLFSSPFDKTAVDLLEDLNAPAYKIASFEAIDLPLIQYVASTGKPMIISTGMADDEEISEAVNAAEEAGCQQLALLHCVSGYPAPASDYNLRTITDMQERFKLPIGLSDHTLDNITALSSVALGACIIEKHVTLDRSNGGPDDSFSLQPNELKQLTQDIKTAWAALGKVDYGRKSSEQTNVKFRRSLYFVKDIKAGEVVTDEHVKSVRPGFGLVPKNYPDVIGRTMLQAALRGTPVSWALLK